MLCSEAVPCYPRPARSSLDGDPTPRAAGFTSRAGRGEPAAVGDGPGSVPNAAASVAPAPLPLPLNRAAASPAGASAAGQPSAAGNPSFQQCVPVMRVPCQTCLNFVHASKQPRGLRAAPVLVKAP